MIFPVLDECDFKVENLKISNSISFKVYKNDIVQEQHVIVGLMVEKM